jgi:hypothetical protein
MQVHTPFMYLVDYLGYRFVAMATLPISNTTLQYGSCDGGQSFIEPNIQFGVKLPELFQELSTKLKIGYHYLQHHKNLVWGPGDMEIHSGLDGRAYVLDLSRLSPPMDFRQFPDPSGNNRGRQLTDLFRFEYLVKEAQVPLSSDAFTKFSSSLDKTENEAKISEITKNFLHIFLPQKIQQWTLNAMKFPDWLLTSYNGSATHLLHDHGINAKFLGICWELCKNEHLRLAFFGEMILRVFKDKLKIELRDMPKIVFPPKENISPAIVSLVNDLLLLKTESIPRILAWIKSKYFFFGPHQISVSLTEVLNIRSRIILGKLMKKVGLNCTVDFSNRTWPLSSLDFGPCHVVTKFRYQFVENSSMYKCSSTTSPLNSTLNSNFISNNMMSLPTPTYLAQSPSYHTEVQPKQNIAASYMFNYANDSSQNSAIFDSQTLHQQQQQSTEEGPDRSKQSLFRNLSRKWMDANPFNSPTQMQASLFNSPTRRAQQAVSQENLNMNTNKQTSMFQNDFSMMNARPSFQNAVSNMNNNEPFYGNDNFNANNNSTQNLIDWKMTEEIRKRKK